MSTDGKRNSGHSVFRQLLDQSKIRGENLNFLLVRYGIERLLHRLSVSPYTDKFILKGASLFLVWRGQTYRVTKDADLLSAGSADAEHLAGIFKELCRYKTEEWDGIKFIPDSVRALPIREGQVYGGVRVTLMGILHHARIPLQIDIGFGDAVTPEPEQIRFPTLLGAPPPRLSAYPRYTVVAEKFETMVKLGVSNSRMKDFYDVWLMGTLFEFNGPTLYDAIRNTFRRRSTPLPGGLPVAFTNDFWKDAQKQTQWRAFIHKSNPEDVPGDSGVVMDKIAEFLMPVLEAVRENISFIKTWPPNGPWG